MRVMLACALLAGCAVAPQPVERPLAPGEIISADAAQKLLSAGMSSKADVRAALGNGTVVDFASGYEVWVYRQRRDPKAAAPDAELVLLFAPSGTLSRTRVNFLRR